MLAVGRVLLVLLAGIPVCRGDGAPGAVYSSYYDAYGDTENPDFCDSYNDEIKQPPERTTVMEAHTRLKRNDLEDIRTLNPGEIIDVKGVLNKILQGKKRDTSREQPAPDYTDSYEYLENSKHPGPEDRTLIASEFKKWLPTVDSQRSSPTVDTQEEEEGSSSQATDQHWSVVYQTETSTYSENDIIAEVRKMMPEGAAPKRSSIDLQYWKPEQVQTFGTAENTEETENTIDIGYPQETTTYSNAIMQSEDNKIVLNPSPNTNVIDLYPQETTTYSNSEMQAEVKKLVQHWSPNSKQDSTYNDAAVRAEVRKLVQHWSPSSGVKGPSNTNIVQLAMSKAPNSEIHQQKPVMQSRLLYTGTLRPGRPMSDLKHHSPSENAVQQWNPSDIVQQRDHFHSLQHQLPSEKDLVKTPAVKGEQKTAVKVHHWSRTGNAETWKSLEADDEETTLDPDDFTGVMREGESTADNETPEVPPKDPEETAPATENKASATTAPAKETTVVVTTAPAKVTTVKVTTAPAKETTLMVTTAPAKETTVAVTTAPAKETTVAVTTAPAKETTVAVTTALGKETTGAVRTAPENETTAAVRTAPENETTEAITTAPTTTRTTTTRTTTTKPQRMDIDAIMAIISNLTYDYEWNLTEQFNKSIIDHGVPTCPWAGGGQWGPGGAWTAAENASTAYAWDFENSSVVSKCFVCGLNTPEIPRNAYCADAFAGDFLPLMPVDARSRSMIANYRKYCRYIDVQNYVENPEEPRSIYGRFTGGCAVRWTDITGIYTQRTCRSRYRPLLGKHFASKRMAKLELALVNVENGCIISPMATLLPVSRGISLYARFHACVCNTNWCNRATLKQASSGTVLTILVAHWLSHYS